jgi:hypothetical protein
MLQVSSKSEKKLCVDVTNLFGQNKLECFSPAKFFTLFSFSLNVSGFIKKLKEIRGCIFSCAQPFYELTVSDLERPMHRPLWVWVAHSSFIEGSHMTKNTASVVNATYLFLSK